ncbi:MAG: hypothetical protein CUN56_01520 [Phototrophicales bacterium]|nr:MAG: hypothetical protein CUN56_01520 [Phototrophicales bacterium]RMG74447.1 MAG: serine/threonine protein kinase [Chloroflexota bacterium]
MSDPLLGKQFGNYQIKKRLMDGGMSMVYVAYDSHREEDVVIKLLHDKYVANPDVASRFEREIKIAKSLHHQYIVPFYDFGKIHNKPYIVLKYMVGGSLNDIIKSGAALSLSRVSKWLSQVSQALDYAHSKGIIHRDLKPGNVLIDENDDASLTDFGIARVVDGTQLTRTDMPMPGTARFMSPEQAIGADDLDYRSDIYSLAVLAYMLVVGDYPFDGPNEVAIILKHVDQQPPRPSQVNPKLPKSLDRVLLKSMAKKPSERHQSAGEFAAEFAEAVAKHGDVITVQNPDMIAPTRPASADVLSTLPGLLEERRKAQNAKRRRSFSGRLVRILAVFSTIILGVLLGALVLLPNVMSDQDNNPPPTTLQTPTRPPAPTVPLLDVLLQTATATLTLPTPSITPTPTPYDVPNNWQAGTVLYVTQQTGIAFAAGADPINPEQFSPGDTVTVTRGLVEGNQMREWFTLPDGRWWYVVSSDGTSSGWLPESVLSQNFPPELTPESTSEA